MDQTTRNDNMTWWISSLSICVVCCALLFVVFASYIFDLKTSFASANLQIEMLSQRQRELINTVESIQRRNLVQQIQIISAAPAAAAAALPTAIPAIENAVQEPAAMPAISPPTITPAAVPSVPPPAMTPPVTIAPAAAPAAPATK
jgi:hypothetical protein